CGTLTGDSSAGVAAQATTFLEPVAGAVACAWGWAKASEPKANANAAMAAHLINDMKSSPYVTRRFLRCFGNSSSGGGGGPAASVPHRSPGETQDRFSPP